MWDPVAAELAVRFHVVAYDVRGAGASSAPRQTAAYDFERLGDDFGAVIDALAPGKRVHVVGHDWGGLQGWEFATAGRFAGRLASFTAVAGPSLDQVAFGGELLLRRRRFLEWLTRLRRSWYILVLLTPGGPTLAWRRLAGDRWKAQLQRDRVVVDASYPAPTLVADGVHGARLYRRNMPRRSVRPRREAFAHVPVQLIIPTHDRFIPVSYYELAERFTPLGLRRFEVDGTHWLPRTHPREVAAWVAEFVEEVEEGV